MIFIHVVGTFRIPFCIRKEIARKLICMCIYETNQRRKAIQTARDKKSKAKAISPQFLLETDLRHWQGHSGFLSGGIEKIPFGAGGMRFKWCAYGFSRILRRTKSSHLSTNFLVRHSGQKIYPTAWTTGWNRPELASGFHTSTSDVMQRRGDGNLWLWHKLLQALGSTGGPWFCLVRETYPLKNPQVTPQTCPKQTKTQLRCKKSWDIGSNLPPTCPPTCPVTVIASLSRSPAW